MRLSNVLPRVLQYINRDALGMAETIREGRRACGKPADALVPNHVIKAVHKNKWLTRLRANGTVSTALGDDGLGYPWTE